MIRCFMSNPNDERRERQGHGGIISYVEVRSIEYLVRYPATLHRTMYSLPTLLEYFLLQVTQYSTISRV